MSDDNQGKQWLSELLLRCGLESTISVEPPDIGNPQLLESSGTWLTIDADALASDQVQVLTARDMTALDAVQYLLNSTLNMGRPAEEREAYTVELGTFRAQRYTELSVLAAEAAAKVRESQEEYQMPPLSGAERRLIHTILCDEADLETYSRGEGADRRLMISPVSSEEQS
ncbi:MAG: R3H domain-containing nucleic acid-binding protein [Cyanobacteria bacterium P01_A01_bin.17]